MSNHRQLYRSSSAFLSAVPSGFVRELRLRANGSRACCFRLSRSGFSAAANLLQSGSEPRDKKPEAEAVNISYQTLTELADKLLHSFHDLSVLAEATIHKSCVNGALEHNVCAEIKKGIVARIEANNEKMELLGDRVFGLLVAGYFFRNAQLSEGQLSQTIHAKVSRKNADYYCR